MVKAIFQLRRDVFSESPRQAHPQRMLLILDAHRQSGREVILGIIGLGKGVVGEQVRVPAEGISAAGNDTVNSAPVWRHRGHAIGRAEGSGGLIGERGGQGQAGARRERAVDGIDLGDILPRKKSAPGEMPPRAASVTVE